VRLPVYKLQLVDARTHERVIFEGRSEMECDLVQAIVDDVETRPIGLFRSKARVLVEVEAAVVDALDAFKRRVVTGG
jgi:hypothetical protein